MTDGLCLANTQWQSGTQDVLLNWPSLEEVERRAHMTDGLYLSVSQDEAERAASEITIHPQIDLSTFSQWISLQPIEVHVWMLEEIANDLSRCHYGWQADEIRMVAKNLWAMVRRTP